MGDRERKRAGVVGEQAAADRYVAGGYRVLARNWRCPLGELDLILVRGSTVVICEVKARRSDALGGPHEAVTHTKRRKLRALAEAYLLSAGLDPAEIRFDVASVSIGSSGPDVHVFEQAF
jgi:putative endonuclease